MRVYLEVSVDENENWHSKYNKLDNKQLQRDKEQDNSPRWPLKRGEMRKRKKHFFLPFFFFSSRLLEPCCAFTFLRPSLRTGFIGGKIGYPLSRLQSYVLA